MTLASFFRLEHSDIVGSPPTKDWEKKKDSHSRISRKSRKISTMDGRSPVSQKVLLSGLSRIPSLNGKMGKLSYNAFVRTGLFDLVGTVTFN